MTAQVRLYNDGPDDVQVAFLGKDGKIINTLHIAAGAGTVVATSAALNFTPIRKPTIQELANEYGVSLDEYKLRSGHREPTRYAEGD